MNPLKAIMPSVLPWGYQIVGTLIATASLTVLCWYLSQNGLLDIAATGLSFFIVTVTRQIAPSLSSRAHKTDFANSAQILEALRNDFSAWMSRCRRGDQTRCRGNDFSAWMSHRRVLGHVLIAIAATLLFLVCRLVASSVLTMIASPLLALALGLAVTAAIASPVLIKALIDTVTSSAAPTKESTDA